MREEVFPPKSERGGDSLPESLLSALRFVTGSDARLIGQMLLGRRLRLGVVAGTLVAVAVSVFPGGVAATTWSKNVFVAKAMVF